MIQSSTRLHLRLWCRYCQRVIFRSSFLPKRNVTLRTDERRVFLSLVNLVIQSAAVICRCGDVTSVRAAARSHRNLQRLCVERTEGRARRAVTTHTVQIGMRSTFMPESAGGNTPAPFAKHGHVG